MSPPAKKDGGPLRPRTPSVENQLYHHAEDQQESLLAAMRNAGIQTPLPAGVPVDPLAFFRDIVRDISAKFYTPFCLKEARFGREKYEDDGRTFYTADYALVTADVRFSTTRSISLNLECRNAPSSFLEYLDGERTLARKPFSAFSIAASAMSDFGSYASRIELDIEHAVKTSKEKYVMGIRIRNIGRLVARQPKTGLFVLTDIRYSDFDDEHTFLRDQRKDAAFFGSGQLDAHSRKDRLPDGGERKDFRPYLHRMLESYASVPQKKWHDPAIYSASRTPDPVLERAIELLFKGSEAAQYKAQLARLSLQCFQSVPRLSLGAIQLPPIGTKDVLADEFILHTAPLLVEAFAYTLGRQDAEALIAQRLTHYFLHERHGQLSRNRLAALLEGLKNPLISGQLSDSETPMGLNSQKDSRGP